MFKDIFNITNTENGHLAYNTTDSKLLNLFASIGALRNRNEEECFRLFEDAYSEDKDLFKILLLYARDIEYGLGEREIFRRGIKFLATKNEFIHIEQIEKIGRLDDLYAYFDTQYELTAGNFFKSRIKEDLNSENPSLLGKWLKSENATSKETKRLARKTMQLLGFTPRQYRKVLTKLRNKIKIIEHNVTTENFDNVNYEQVPSLAMIKYSNVFNKKDPKFTEYKNLLKEGKVKVNNKVYPYEIYRAINTDNQEVLEAQWNNLPDLIGNHNAIVMADVSGSMTGTPMQMSISLALYFAERNKGELKNKFMTFSEKPSFVTIKGSNLLEKFSSIRDSEWGYNTDLNRAFKLMLERCKALNVKPDEIPEYFIIISDMEIDEADENKFLYDELKDLFEENGYKIPKLVYWNVNSRHDIFLQKDNCILVSGASINVFKGLFESDCNPYKFMINTLEKYYNLRFK